MRQSSERTSASTRLRTVYFGTPEFAVPALIHIATSNAFDLRLVVTQPDRPAGRGRRLVGSPVKAAAESLGLPVYQPVSLRTPDLRQPIAAIAADLFVVAAYGIIFGPRTLSLPRIASINIHASVLPSYRGANPICAAIAQGEQTTGVSLMEMDTGLDTGPVISVRSTPVGQDDTTESLTARLANLGAELVAVDLERFAAGERHAVPQSQIGASVTRPLVKSDGWLDWSRPAEELERRVRAMWPWPRAWTTVDGEAVQIHASTVVAMGDADDAKRRPGSVIRIGSRPVVFCSSGGLALDFVQRPGGHPAPGESLLRGRESLDELELGRDGVPEPRPGPLVVSET